jgi:deazaflavin-dependent oxidoreductase (nitroreductase family)
MMDSARYLRPPWGARVIGNRMARIFARDVLSTLAVRGRRTGRWRTVPVAVLDYEGDRYLIAPRGETDWVRNLRAAGGGRLTRRGETEDFHVVEVAVADRPPLISAYLGQFGRFPTVRPTFRELPDPADHPTFRLTGPRRTG